ncbi:MAG: hypothetical protein WBW69_00715 [Candidatus Korobacteraceae bacterium]
MKKDLLFLGAFTTVAMLIAVLIVMKYSVPIAAAFIPVVLVFVVFAAFLILRGRRRDLAADGAASEKSQTALKWMFVPFGIGAVIALVMSLQEGWTVGDTVGAIFVGIFGLLIAYELFRRRRRATRLH